MRILPDPDRSYATLKAELVRLGWVWASETQALPLLRGEPEWVEYRHPAGGTLRYEYNPAIGLRQIDADAPAERLRGLADLPHLGPADVAVLLDGPGAEAILRGLFAARALRLMPLLPRIHALCTHADDLVRRAAADVAATLPPAAVRDGWQRFQALRAQRPERSALLAMMPVADQRQVLRWMGRDRRAANADVLAALRTGLAGEDAEVRATAALVAARLGAAELAADVRGLVLPARLAAAQACAAQALAAGARLQLPDPVDDASLLLHALLEPLPDVPRPPRLPKHLRDDGGTVRLARSGLAVALVPSLPHWLGGAEPVRPLRRISARPFAIAVEPFDARAAELLGVTVAAAADGTLRVTLAEAADLARRLGVLEGAAIGLPDAEGWEMALRGPDGRRTVSGNLDAEPAISPWGVAVLPGSEWVAGGIVRDASSFVEPARAAAVTSAPEARHAARFAFAFPA